MPTLGWRTKSRVLSRAGGAGDSFCGTGGVASAAMTACAANKTIKAKPKNLGIVGPRPRRVPGAENTRIRPRTGTCRARLFIFLCGGLEIIAVQRLHSPHRELRD